MVGNLVVSIVLARKMHGFQYCQFFFADIPLVKLIHENFHVECLMVG